MRAVQIPKYGQIRTETIPPAPSSSLDVPVLLLNQPDIKDTPWSGWSERITSSEDVNSFCLGLYHVLTRKKARFFFLCIYCDSYNELAAVFGLCCN